MLETARLLIRHMEEKDGGSFTEGIAGISLRTAYGFPQDMEESVPARIFHHFRGMDRAYSLIEKATGDMAGFLLDVDPELPEDVREGLPEKGRTLAYAVFPPYQRRGYMTEALEAYISALFQKKEAEYIHCGHFSENGPGGMLLQKLNFHEYARHRVNGRIIVDEILPRSGAEPAR